MSHVPLIITSSDSRRGRNNTKNIKKAAEKFDYWTRKANRIEDTEKIKETVKYMEGS